MTKETITKNNVGTNCIRPHFEGIAKRNNGITLIALIITIIVMIILVAVSVTVALNGGLFKTAKGAATGTEAARDNELALSEGQIEVDGKKYASYEDYLNNKPMVTEPTVPATYKTSVEGLAQGVSLVPYAELTGDLKAAADEEKIIAILKETIDGTEKTAVIPKGFEVSTQDGEDSISEGLVIYDGTLDNRNNEFVWIPVQNATSYTEDSFGPLTGTDSYGTTFVWDSQEQLDYYYGEDYYNYNDFTYEADKTNVENNIKTYGGFYVGRYETTYDSVDENNVPQGIGIKQGKNILTTASILQSGTNSTSNDEYHYRWWGLYKAQKDMYTNNQAVGSLMISSKQWDAIITYTGYGSATRATETYTSEPDLAGSAYKTDNTKYDVSKNIYDLAGNVYEFTLKAGYTFNRTNRGGDCNSSYGSASYSDSVSNPSYSYTYSRF